jgi:alpha-tubulin suppressor-like RCC1 family protein
MKTKRILSVVLAMVMILSISFVVHAQNVVINIKAPVVYKEISAGFECSFALKEDGTVWSWGADNFSLEDTSKTVPVQINGITNVMSVSASMSGAIMLKDDGTVWGTGMPIMYSSSSFPDFSKPVQFAGLQNITAISSGLGHYMALKSDGTVWAWGMNNYGQVGNGKSDPMVPVSIPTMVQGISDVKAISAGGVNSLVLKNDGTVWEWGATNASDLMNAPTDLELTPKQITELSSITEISNGLAHSTALDADGNVWDWGNNEIGQLGDGTTNYESRPVKLTTVSNIKSISAGAYNTIFLKDDNSVLICGGVSGFNEGDPKDAVKNPTPQIVAGLDAIKSISSGEGQNMVLTQDGKIKTWGFNASGQLGNGTKIDSLTPVDVEVFSDIEGISWAKDSIVFLAGQGIINGMGDGTFKPNGNITRAQFASIIVNTLGKTNDVATSNFTDVKSGQWYYNAVSIAFKNNYIHGRSATVFAPNDNISRQDLCVIMANALNLTSLNPDTSLAAFKDSASINDYAKNAVAACFEEGLINGMPGGLFAPKGNATRAQASVIIKKAFDKYGVNA